MSTSARAAPKAVVFRQRRWMTEFLGLVIATLLVRGSVLVLQAEQLTIDRDAYLGIAENVWRGVGFCTAGTSQPTAFRPPLYPLLLAPFVGLAGVSGIAILQVLASLAGVLGTWAAARVIEKQTAWLAGAIVLVDPLLLTYTPQPMTETVCAALVAVLLWAWLNALQPAVGKTGRTGNWVGVGLCFGLAAACRPSLLPIPLTAIALLLCDHARQRIFRAEPTQASSNPCARRTRQQFLVLAVGLLVLLPWGVRNAWVFGEFKLTTTHGGYTLLLGNNRTFDAAVVQQPWRTDWGDYPAEDPLSQPQWIEGVQRAMRDAGVQGEFAEDRWQFARAMEFLRQHPDRAAAAGWLRFRRFWSPVPVAAEVSPLVRSGLLLFYGGLYLAAFWGLALGLRSAENSRLWLPGLAIVGTLVVVHFFFWTNARMRIPVIPVLAVWAASAVPVRGGVLSSKT